MNYIYNSNINDVFKQLYWFYCGGYGYFFPTPSDNGMYNKLYSLWFDAVPTKTNKSSDGVLDSVKSLFKEDKVDIPETVNDHAQRTGSRCLGASTNNYCKSIIMLFTTFRHRTMLCRAKNKLKRSVRIKFDLTKPDMIY